MADSKSTPLVSVVIPMFNAFPFIGEMLECMEKQSYTNWELIIVDDGSTDESISTVEQFVEKDSRIKLIKRPGNRKKGGNTCRNIGLENANGEYIIWFDADDLIAPYCLKQRIEYIHQNKNIDVAIAPLLGFNKKPYDSQEFALGVFPPKEVVKKFLANALPFVVVTNIYRKSSLELFKIKWDEDLKSHQDADFNLDCINQHLKFANASNACADYFWRLSGNENSVSKKIVSKSHLQTNIYYFNKQVERFEHNPIEGKNLTLLVNYITKTLIFQDDESMLSEFLEQSYFNEHKWLKASLRFINRFQHRLKIKSHFPTNLLTLALCPALELAYRREIYKGHKFQKHLARLLNK